MARSLTRWASKGLVSDQGRHQLRVPILQRRRLNCQMMNAQWSLHSDHAPSSSMYCSSGVYSISLLQRSQVGLCFLPNKITQMVSCRFLGSSNPNLRHAPELAAAETALARCHGLSAAGFPWSWCSSGSPAKVPRGFLQVFLVCLRSSRSGAGKTSAATRGGACLDFQAAVLQSDPGTRLSPGSMPPTPIGVARIAV